MQAKLSSEQEMLQESAGRYLRDRYSFAERTRIVASADGYDKLKWRDFAEMGWLGLPFPEEHGGSGATMFEVMLLMKEFGRSLVVEPFLSSVVLGGLTVLYAGDKEQKRKFLSQIAAGQTQVALGFAEPEAGYNAHTIRTAAKAEGEGFRLNGKKAVVFGAPSSDYMIVSARTSGEPSDMQGISLFIFQRSTPGVTLRSYQTIDGRRAAEVVLDDVRLGRDQLIGEAGSGGPVIDQVLMAGRVAVVGEAVGSLNGAIDRTIEYLNTREQFGKKLASFQALRHRVADMYVLTREADALAGVAAQAFISSESPGRFAAVSGAKAYVGEKGRWVAENAVQLHGAIAIADEYIVGHYLKRVVSIDRLFGDVEHNLEDFMKSAGPLAQCDRFA